MNEENTIKNFDAMEVINGENVSLAINQEYVLEKIIRKEELTENDEFAEVKNKLPIIIGTEVELLVLDDSFQETNKASRVLELIKKNSSLFVHECSQCNVEFVGNPGVLKKAVLEAIKQLEDINEITKKEGINLLPVDFPLNHSFEAQITNHPRYKNKEIILGKNEFDICKRIIGTHVHFDLDLDPDIKISQINFLALFDPLAITATATSRNVLNGNIINNWRVYAYRYMAHQEFPFQGDIQNLFNTYEEYVQTLDQEYNNFLKKSLEKGVDFSTSSSKENAVWGPVRINTKYKTVEMRSMSSHPDMITVFSVVALASGAMRRIIKREINIKDICAFLTGTYDLKEASAFLKNIDYKATLYGFKSQEVRDYCEKLVLICKQGLEAEEKDIVEKGFERWMNQNLVERIVLSNMDYKEKYKALHEIYISSLQELKKMFEE